MNTEATMLVEQYIAAWNERDARKRRSLIDQIFTEKSTYTDPNDSVVGRDAIERLVVALQAKFPEFRFTISGPINAHHQQVLFAWKLGSPGAASPAATGVDMALLEDGRISQLHGFVDQAAA
jgi:SnoaL-like domain